MRNTYKVVNIVSIIIFLCSLFLVFRFEINQSIPENFYATSLQSITLDTFVPFIKLKIKPDKNFVPVGLNGEIKHKCTLRCCGIPLKNIDLNIVNRKTVIPYGVPFGAKIFINGVMVVKIAPVETDKGDLNPASIASIKKGDIITHVNGHPINSNDELSEIIEKSNGHSLKLKITRGGSKIDISVTPVKSAKENVFRLGLWVRDSSSGIGTITFCDKNRKLFAGLGHAIKDLETDKAIPLSRGEIVRANIKSVLKPSKNSTGELRGCFLGDKIIGTIELNNDSGLYGRITSDVKSKFATVQVAMKQEVKVGPAQIISTVEGTDPAVYDINIDKINFDKREKNKNISITICDKNLIDKTGGIVQGMSGSPIIQNGMLVGAVTHVVADNSLKGYGIFAETMINNIIFG